MNATRTIVVVALGFLALMATAGQAEAVAPVVARVLPAESHMRTGDRLVVRVEVDVGQTGQRLGAYGASLYWVPGVLRFVGHAGGSPPFNSPQVNTADASLGLLRFADADPVGAAGVVTLINVTFDVIGAPCGTSFLNPEFDSMSTASTFEDLTAMLSVAGGTAMVTDAPFGVTVSDPVDTILDWTAVPGAASYDVIRGQIEQLRDNGVAISLGQVTCIENDSLDTTTAAGTEAFTPDTGTPMPGRAFFYLVRFDDGTSSGSYGFTDGCGRERIPDAGDCP